MSRPSIRALRPRHYLILFAALIGLILIIVLPTVLTRHSNPVSQDNSPSTTPSNGPQLNITQGRISPGGLVNCTDIQCDMRVMTERRLSTIIGRETLFILFSNVEFTSAVYVICNSDGGILGHRFAILS